MKSQINIKKGNFKPLSVEEAGKPFSFQIIIEDMIGKSDDANMILAAHDENAFNQWKEDFFLCFSIGDTTRRRKSSIITSNPQIALPPEDSESSKKDEASPTLSASQNSDNSNVIEESAIKKEPKKEKKDIPMIKTKSYTKQSSKTDVTETSEPSAKPPVNFKDEGEESSQLSAPAKETKESKLNRMKSYKYTPSRSDVYEGEDEDESKVPPSPKRLALPKMEIPMIKVKTYTKQPFESDNGVILDSSVLENKNNEEEPEPFPPAKESNEARMKRLKSYKYTPSMTDVYEAEDDELVPEESLLNRPSFPDLKVDASALNFTSDEESLTKERRDSEGNVSSASSSQATTPSSRAARKIKRVDSIVGKEVLKLEETIISTISRSTSNEDKRRGSFKKYDAIEVLVTSDDESHPKPPDSPPHTKQEMLEQQLEKLGRRKSYKPPKKLGSILNSKGMTKDMEEEIKRVKEGGPSEETKASSSEGIASMEDEQQQEKEKEKEQEKPPASRPRQLMISVRPTSAQREGYLFKLDNSGKELGEDPWISQFISLEVATGILQFYAELGGRRIPRGKVSILDSTVEPIDFVYFGRLYAFKLLTTLPPISEEFAPQQVTSTFAAEDLESYSYWLISFDDCFKYQDELKEKKERDAQEAKMVEEQRMQMAADSIARSRSSSAINGINLNEHPTPGINLPLTSSGSFYQAHSTGDKKGSMRLDHLEARLSNSGETKDSYKEEPAIMNRAVSHKFHEDPGLSRPPSFRIPKAETTFAADDMNNSLTRRSQSFRENNLPGTPNSAGFGPIIQLTDNNLDDILKFEPKTVEMTLNKKDSAHEMLEIKQLEFIFKKAIYPADRLTRRVKIWYCSGGFSLSSEDEITQFVDALKSTDDLTLKAFSEEKFEHIHDWSNLLEVLRKYEQKVLTESIANDNAAGIVNSNGTDDNLSNPHVRFVYEITLPKRPDLKLSYEFTEEFDFDDLIKKMNETFGYSDLSLLACIPPLLTNKDSNPWSTGLMTVKEDLLFAEDLVLYQEEVIEHMWESYTALKAVIEQKDEVINQLYNQMSDLQDKVASNQSVQQTLFAPTSSGSGYGGSVTSSSLSKSARQTTKELQVLADREFYAADKVLDLFLFPVFSDVFFFLVGW
jgi:uncharacterized coiled-coil protein SlyX